jgi:hypothetical protein
LATALAAQVAVASVVAHLAPLLLLVRQEQPILAAAAEVAVLGIQEHLLVVEPAAQA